MTRIILIEDHPIMQMVITRTLERIDGVRVVDVINSADATLAYPRIEDVDLLLVDISLPDANGIDLVRELVRTFPSLRCLMLSAHLEHAYVAHALNAGARGYVAKEDADELVEAVRSVLDGRIFVSRALRTHP